MKPAEPNKKLEARANAAPQLAARAVIQILSATGKRYTVDGLREKLRELFKMEGNCEIRAVASMSNVELIAALLQANQGLEPFGLQLGIANGLVSLGTIRVDNYALRDFIAAQRPVNSTGELSQAAMEVLGCIALKQPLGQKEIDRYFDADKRGVVHRLRESGLVEEITGGGGRLMLATTEAFLRKFNLRDLDELKRAGFS